MYEKYCSDVFKGSLDIQIPPVMPCEEVFFGIPKSLRKGDVWGFKHLRIRCLDV